jgi:hypothetical protein
MRSIGAVNITTVVKEGAIFGHLNFKNVNGNSEGNVNNTINIVGSLKVQDERLSNWNFQEELSMSKLRFGCVLAFAVVSLLVLIAKAVLTWNETRHLRKQLADIINESEAPATTNQLETRRNDELIY